MRRQGGGGEEERKGEREKEGLTTHVTACAIFLLLLFRTRTGNGDHCRERKQ
jgi:hypothetical protein